MAWRRLDAFSDGVFSAPLGLTRVEEADRLILSKRAHRPPRRILQHGAALAVGLGENASTIAGYAATNLDLFSFELDVDEMALLDAK